MKKITVKDGLYLKAPTPLRDLCCDLLTFRNPAYDNALRHSPWGYCTLPEHLCHMRETEDGRIILPRAFRFDKLPAKWQKLVESLLTVDKRVTAPVTFPTPKIALNDQQTAMLKALNHAIKRKLRPYGNYLLISSTSTGKTIAQASCAASLGQRTLVLCKTNLIRQAWEQDLQKLYGIDKKEIGIIQQSKNTIGKHFTLSSLATLNRRREKWPEIFSNFGTVILDEVHILPAKSIADFIEACPCKNIVGATATLNREDGRHTLTKLHFGDPIIRIKAVAEETESSMPITDVREVVTNFTTELEGKDLDLHALYDEMTTDDKRNDLIVQKVFKQWMLKRSILVTTNRVAHVHLLKAMFEEIGIKHVQALTGGQGMKSEVLIARLMSRKSRVVVATDAVVSTGANINVIDRLHVAMPIRSRQKLEQLMGRIRRKCSGKKDAIVYYYRDKRSPYLNRIFKDTLVPVAQKMAVKRWENVYLA